MKISKPNTEEVVMAVVKGAISGVPIVGGIGAELIGTVIPNRRLDRVEDMYNRLVLIMDKQEPGCLARILDDDDFFGLFEQGVIDAAKATTSARIENIVNILNSGFHSRGSSMTAKVCLSIIGDLSDLELGLLLHMHDVLKHAEAQFNTIEIMNFAEKFFELTPEPFASDNIQNNKNHGYWELVYLRLSVLKEKYIVIPSQTGGFRLTEMAKVIATFARS